MKEIHSNDDKREMTMKKHREIFFTAVLVSGLAACLFGSEPQMDVANSLEAGVHVVQTQGEGAPS